MPNVTEIANFKANLPYLPDGVAAALEGLTRNIPQNLKIADSITYYSNGSLTTDPTTVDIAVGSRPLVIAVESRGAAGYVFMYDANATASATTSLPDFIVPVATTTGEVTAVFVGGASWAGAWSEGLIIASSAANAAARTAIANGSLPRVYMLYHNG